jgi:hypothetical protein
MAATVEESRESARGHDEAAPLAAPPAHDGPAPEREREDEPDHEPAFGAILVAWMALTLLIQGSLWFTGFRTTALSMAVEQGAARAESRFIGEVGDDVIRKAVRTQHETLPFWTVIAFLGDFLGEPAWLGARAILAATAFASVAALMGRPIGYDRSLAACATAQGIWVASLALRAGLMIALRRPEVETSAALFLPAGAYPAWLWLILRQADAFALVGWFVMARGGIRRRQVGWWAAFAVCAGIGLLEAAVRVGFGLVVGAGMRLTVMPA